MLSDSCCKQRVVDLLEIQGTDQPLRKNDGSDKPKKDEKKEPWNMTKYIIETCQLGFDKPESPRESLMQFMRNKHLRFEA